MGVSRAVRTALYTPPLPASLCLACSIITQLSGVTCSPCPHLSSYLVLSPPVSSLPHRLLASPQLPQLLVAILPRKMRFTVDHSLNTPPKQHIGPQQYTRPILTKENSPGAAMDLRRSLALGRILAGGGGASVSWRGHRQATELLSPAKERRSSSVQEHMLLPGVGWRPGRGSSPWDEERELKGESSGAARRWRGCLSDEKEKDFLGLRLKYTLSCSTSARGTATYVFLSFFTEDNAKLLWSSRVSGTPATSDPLGSHGPSGGGVRGEGGGDSHTGDILPLE